jgi:hypothetical protein
MSSVITPHGSAADLAGSSTGGGNTPPSRRPGGRPGSFALLLLLGVLGALVILVVWQFVVQTSAELNQPERIRGWSVVLLELPATLLLFAPVIAGLTLAVRSARLGSRRGVAAIWLHSLALFLVVLVVVQGSAEGIMTTSAANAAWLLFPPAACAAIAALVLCLRAARSRPQDKRTASPPDRKPCTARFRLAILLPIVGIAGGFIWLFAAEAALSGHASGFARASVPGAVTLPVGHAGTYYVYAEGNAPDTLGDLAVQVTGPAGGVVPVKALTPRPVYLRHLRGGRAVGTFEASRTGDYRVAATGNQPPVAAPYAPSNPYGDFAVGNSVANWMQPHERGVAALLFVTVGSSIVLTVATATRRRRSQAASGRG